MLKSKNILPELPAKVTCFVIPAKAGIRQCLKILDYGSPFALYTMRCRASFARHDDFFLFLRGFKKGITVIKGILAKMLISWGNFFSFLGIGAEAPEREKRDQVLGMAGREGGMKRMERNWET
ncbi:MAG: hypothetical protein KKH04_02345 [Proteobacteria bacterium]|nr:hypothetical protein [Pseudomonadota bacterium]